MGAVANVTVLGDTSTVSRTLSAIMSPEFKKEVVFVPLIYSEDMPNGQATNVKGFRRQGAMTATNVVAEATAQGIHAPRQDTAVNATAAKVVRVDGISVENQKFGQVSLDSYALSQGRAIGRAVDDTGLALFSSITNQVDAAGDLTLDHLDEGQFNIFASEVPMSGKNLVSVLGARGFKNIKADVRQSGGAALSNERFLSIFNGPPQINGYIGSVPGIDLYAVQAGLGTTGGKNIQAIFHPDWAFAGIFDPSVSVWVNEKGSEGLYWEMVSYYFFSIVLWNDAAACELLSNT